MPIKPEDINAENLPQGVRGYQREATENLLKLVAWDYRRVIREHAVDKEELQRVRAQVEQLESELQTERGRQPADPQLEIQAQVAQRTSLLRDEVDRLRASLAHQADRAVLSEKLLDSALRSARQLREETRAECDSILRAARRRAVEIEGEARHTVKRAGGEVERLQQMERDLRGQLKRILESVIDGQKPSEAPVETAAPAPPDDTLTLPPSWSSTSD